MMNTTTNQNKHKRRAGRARAAEPGETAKCVTMSYARAHAQSAPPCTPQTTPTPGRLRRPEEELALHAHGRPPRRGPTAGRGHHLHAPAGHRGRRRRPRRDRRQPRRRAAHGDEPHDQRHPQAHEDEVAHRPRLADDLLGQRSLAGRARPHQRSRGRASSAGGVPA